MTDAIDFKELVRSRTDLVALVGESVALSPRRGGAEFVGLCPFHDDHNPSMCVYPDRQSFRCWVCEEGGDAFTFVMKHERVTFLEALDLLAERVGLERPKRQVGSREGEVDKPRTLDVLAWAERQFRTCFSSAKEAAAARDYVAGRGISAEMVERFGIGFVPRDWHWLLNRARGVYNRHDLQAAGLVKERREGDGLTDFFVDRVMFPIRDERGRPVSFGGRILPAAGDSAGPKYLNGGDTAVFPKSRLVYALDLAREAIKKKKMSVVMEGYTDVIAAHQRGVTNVVATLGTALTETQVTLLRRFSDTVVLVYDGDEAGQKAAERALGRFLTQDVDLRILTLPQGLDPADFLANDGGGEFESLLASAPSALDYKLKVLLGRFDPKTEYGRSRIVQEVLSAVAAAPQLAGSIREGAILRTAADRLGLREQSLRDELKQLRAKGQQSQRPTPTTPATHSTPSRGSNPPQRGPAGGVDRTPPAGAAPRNDHPAEREVLCCLLVRPDLFGWVNQQIGPDDFVTPRLRAVFEHYRDVADLSGTPTYDLLMNGAEAPGLKPLLVGLDAEARRKGLGEQLGPAAVLWDAELTTNFESVTRPAVVENHRAGRFGTPPNFQEASTHFQEVGVENPVAGRDGAAVNSDGASPLPGSHRNGEGPLGSGLPDGRDAGGGMMPRLVVDVVQSLVQRRRSRQNERLRGQLARQLAGGGNLDAATKDQLRQYQQQLANRHTP